MLKNIWFIVFILLLVFLLFSDIQSQTTYRIMPMGDGITWGKQNGGDPPEGTHGYRDRLYENLNDEFFYNNHFIFTGPDPGNPYYSAIYDDPGYEGYFRDGARIGHFLPDSVYDVQQMLSSMPDESIPDIVILHIGTNDMDTHTGIGDYAIPGTVTNQLFELTNRILDFSSNGHRIQMLMLCKIIMQSPQEDYPIWNQHVIKYNAAIENMIEHLPASKMDRIDLVDMYSPFLANQYDYYNHTMDCRYPNSQGYWAMADLLGVHLWPHIRICIRDEFNGSGKLDGYNDWCADSTFQLYDNRLVYCNNNNTDAWEQLAVWKQSKNSNKAVIGFPADSIAGNFSSLALAIALNDTNPAVANGYMVWITEGKLRIYTIENGQAGSNAIFGADYLDVIPYGMKQYGPGDSLSVQYREGENNNWFDIQVNDGFSITVRHNTSTWGKERFWGNFYSGLIFRDGSGIPPDNPTAMVDFFNATPLVWHVPPGKIDDFGVFAETHKSITLTWTATGGDGEIGKASSYDLRMSTEPFNAADFNKAEPVPGVPGPLSSGTSETFKVTGLLSEMQYYFRIRAVDEWGWAGMSSNLIYGTTEWTRNIFRTFTADLGGWSYDETEYGPDPQQPDEITCLKDDGGWAESCFIYTGRASPVRVDMIWGDDVTSGDAEQISNGGIALQLDKKTPDANGYFVYIDHSSHTVNLCAIENGRPGSVIDYTDYIIHNDSGDPVFPAAGDTLTVQMDSDNIKGGNFDVYVNYQKAADRVLFAGESISFSPTPAQYAGFLLSRIQEWPDRNNNVRACRFYYEYSPPDSDLYNITPTILDGVVNTPLEDEIVIKVIDPCLQPRQWWPVQFEVKQSQDGGKVDSPPMNLDPIHREAEWGRVMQEYGGSMEKLADPEASGGYYLVSPGGSHHTSWIELMFTVPEQGEYYFWARAVAKGPYQSIVWFELDGMPDDGFAWEVLKDNYSTSDFDWKWDCAVEYGATTVFKRELTATEHCLRLYKGHNNVKLDKIIITRDENFIPQGKEPCQMLLTDSLGLARTTWTLGRKAGWNEVEAIAYGSEYGILFRAYGHPADPDTLYGEEPFEQTGTAGDTLALPFTVVLEDTFGNATPGIPVSWNVISGDGIMEEDTTFTNSDGRASVFLILGADTSHVVRASVQDSLLGEVLFSGIVDHWIETGTNKEETLPVAFALYQNYPNPFNPDTDIRFSVPENETINLSIYNVQGRKVRTLVSGEKKRGFHRVRWDGKDGNGSEVSSGIYIYRLRSDSRVQVKRMVKLK